MIVAYLEPNRFPNFHIYQTSNDNFESNHDVTRRGGVDPLLQHCDKNKTG
jgi:hypothetical protein